MTDSRFESEESHRSYFHCVLARIKKDSEEQARTEMIACCAMLCNAVR